MSNLLFKFNMIAVGLGFAVSAITGNYLGRNKIDRHGKEIQQAMRSSRRANRDGLYLLALALPSRYFTFLLLGRDHS